MIKQVIKLSIVMVVFKESHQLLHYNTLSE